MPDDAASPVSTTGGQTCRTAVSIISPAQDGIVSGSDYTTLQSTCVDSLVSTQVGEYISVMQDCYSRKVKWCPCCLQFNKKIKLQLFQSDLENAMYLCPQENCQFPFVGGDIETYTIQRNFSKMILKRKRKFCHHIGRTPGATKQQKIDLEMFTLDDLPDFWDDDFAFSSDSSGTTDVSIESLLFSFDSPDSLAVSQNNNCGSKLSEITTLFDNGVMLNTELPQISFEFPVVDLYEQCCTTDVDSCASDKIEFENAVLQQSCSPAHQNLTTNVCGIAVTEISVNAAPNPKHCEGNILQAETATEQSENMVVPLPIPRHTFMVQWLNEQNLCWLDVLLHCIVNSMWIRATLNCKVDPEVRHKNIFYRLCKVYDDVQRSYNELTSAQSEEQESWSSQTTAINLKLSQIRMDVFTMLQSEYSLEQGIHESVLEMFSNILRLDDHIKNIFSVQARWEFECEQCKFKKVRRTVTDVLSFCSTCPNFHPLNGAFVRPCFSCAAENQKMSLIMEKVPPCLMMHFQQGLSHSRFRTLDFGIQEHLYSVVAVVQYITNPFNHFIVWIRNCQKNQWICYNDLNQAVCTWKKRAPKIPPRQIHMIMWEKQGIHFPSDDFDDLSKQLLSVVNEESILSGDEFPPETDSENNSYETIVVEDDDNSNERQNLSGSCSLPTTEGRSYVSPQKSSETCEKNVNAGEANSFVTTDELPVFSLQKSPVMEVEFIQGEANDTTRVACSQDHVETETDSSDERGLASALDDSELPVLNITSANRKKTTYDTDSTTNHGSDAALKSDTEESIGNERKVFEESRQDAVIANGKNNISDVEKSVEYYYTTRNSRKRSKDSSEEIGLSKFRFVSTIPPKQTASEEADRFDFTKLHVQRRQASNQLTNGLNMFEAYKPKRSFKLAGYKKAVFDSENQRMPRRSETSKTSSSSVSPDASCKLASSSEKSSETSDFSDFFGSNIDQLSDGSVTTASDGSGSKSTNSSNVATLEGPTVLSRTLTRENEPNRQSASNQTSADLQDLIDNWDFDNSLAGNVENGLFLGNSSENVRSSPTLQVDHASINQSSADIFSIFN